MPSTLIARCTCGARSSMAVNPASSRSSNTIINTATSTRSASTSSHRIRPKQRWLMPDFNARKRLADLPPRRAQKFPNQIKFPDGHVASIYSTSPRPNIAVNRDTSNHPLWAYNSANTDGPQEDEGGRMGRFARRFGSNEGTISSKQEEALKKVDAAVEPLQGVQAGSDAALKVADKQQKQAMKNETTASPPSDNAMDMFDLSLEGEVVEEIKHVQEDTGKKGKAGGKGKKGK